MLSRAANMRLLVWGATDLELMAKVTDLSVILLLHLHLLLFELVDFVSNDFHLIDLLGDLSLDLF